MYVTSVEREKIVNGYSQVRDGQYALLYRCTGHSASWMSVVICDHMR